MIIIPALGRLRKEDREFQASHNYTETISNIKPKM
jgi:hypothetical protein